MYEILKMSENIQRRASMTYRYSFLKSLLWARQHLTVVVRLWMSRAARLLHCRLEIYVSCMKINLLREERNLRFLSFNAPLLQRQNTGGKLSSEFRVVVLHQTLMLRHWTPPPAPLSCAAVQCCWLPLTSENHCAGVWNFNCQPISRWLSSWLLPVLGRFWFPVPFSSPPFSVCKIKISEYYNS